MSKFKIGDQVRILDSTYRPNAATRRRIGNMYQVVAVKPDTFRVDPDLRANGWWYNDSDGELVEAGSGQYGRRTFRQLSDNLTVKRGALWQEACDDGTQEYKLLNPETDSKDGGRQQSVYDRSLIEQSKQFVEVFKVHPEYMTREELDKWEVFKGSKPAIPVATPKSRLSASRLEEVAHYTLDFGPGAAARKFNVSPATASVYLSQARSRGLLQRDSSPDQAVPMQRHYRTKRVSVSDAKFILTYNSSRTAASVAKKLGCSMSNVYNRASVLRKQGVVLKKLNVSKPSKG